MSHRYSFKAENMLKKSFRFGDDELSNCNKLFHRFMVKKQKQQ